MQLYAMAISNHGDVEIFEHVGEQDSCEIFTEDDERQGDFKPIILGDPRADWQLPRTNQKRRVWHHLFTTDDYPQKHASFLVTTLNVRFRRAARQLCRRGDGYLYCPSCGGRYDGTYCFAWHLRDKHDRHGEAHLVECEEFLQINHETRRRWLDGKGELCKGEVAWLARHAG